MTETGASATIPAETPGRRGVLSLLRRNPDFARLYAAQLVSYGGDWFATVALLGLAFELTGRPVAAGLIMALQMLPYGLVSFVAGALADRLDRRMLMIAADLARAALALGFLAARSEDTLWIAYVCVLGISGVSAFFDPSSGAALPNLVRREDLASANVLLGSAWGTMLAVGAAIGGIVAATLGRDAAFLANAASFVVSAGLIATVRSRFHGSQTPAKRRLSADIAESLRFARRNKAVLIIILAEIGFGLVAGLVVLLSVFAVQIFERGEGGIGLLMSARGLGALAGPFVFRRLFAIEGKGLHRAMGIALGVFGFAYLVFSASPTIWVAAIAVVIAHIGGSSIWTLAAYGLQRIAPDAIRGRLVALQYGLTTLGLALSFWVAGLAAAAFSPRAVAATLAVAAVAVAGVWTAATRAAWAGSFDDRGRQVVAVDTQE